MKKYVCSFAIGLISLGGLVFANPYLKERSQQFNQKVNNYGLSKKEIGNLNVLIDSEEFEKEKDRFSDELKYFLNLPREERSIILESGEACLPQVVAAAAAVAVIAAELIVTVTVPLMDKSDGTTKLHTATKHALDY